MRSSEAGGSAPTTAGASCVPTRVCATTSTATACPRGRSRVGCNAFRYGQCNTQIPDVTEVVCRVVVCDHPSSVAAFNCGTTYKQDNRTCGHEAPCLGTPAQEFAW